jgi:hypothetical protein
MSHYKREKLMIPRAIGTTFVVLIVGLALMVASPAQAQNAGKKTPPPGSRPPASGNTCTFWVGDVTTIVIHNEPKSVHLISKTTYHVRLREVPGSEFGSFGNGYEYKILLINAGSRVEGSWDEEFNDYGSPSSWRNSGSGKASVLDPGKNLGSVGYLYMTKKGERVQYHFDIWPDKGASLFPTTKHSFYGDPPRESVTENHGTFMRVYSAGDSTGSSMFAAFTGAGRLMEGEYTIKDPKGNPLNKTSWKLHAEIAPCDQSSSLDTTAQPIDPCGSTANQDALWQHCLDQEKDIDKEIGALKEVQQKEGEEAQSHFADFKLVVNLCKLWDKTKELLEAIVGGPDFLKGLSPADAEEFKEFQETIKLLTEMADKAADGKNPIEAMEPEQIKDWVEKGEKLNKLIEQIDIMLAGYTPESGAKVLEDCSAPISDDIRRSAEQYLEHLKASLDLRSKNNECLKKQWDTYSACVLHARCAGTPESACANKKPPGNWPDVR